MNQIIIKRKGHKEPFDPKKLYASIYAACIALRMREGQSELIADNVSKDVLEEISHHEEIQSKDLIQIVSRLLEEYNEDAAFLYKSHRDIS